MTDILTEKAISWLKEKRDPNKPFSLNLWHKAVHQPHLPAPRHEDLYVGKELPTPPYDTHKETFKGKPEWQRKKTFGFDKVLNSSTDKNLVKCSLSEGL